MLFAAVVLECSEFEGQAKVFVQESVEKSRGKVLGVEIAHRFVEANGFDELGCGGACAPQFIFHVLRYTFVVGGLRDT